MRKLAASSLVALLATAAAGTARADERAGAGESGGSGHVAASAVLGDAALPQLRPSEVTLHPLPTTEARKDHRALALGTLGGVYVGFGAWAYFAWYQDHPANHEFEIGGDGGFERTSYAGGSDKLGHAWATMVLGRASSQMLRFGGWDRRQAAIIGGALSAAAFTMVEYQDAYYYTFSLGDLTADYLGAVAGALLESSDRLDDLVDFRVEYFPSAEYQSILRGDPGRPALDLKRINIAEDYSGQRYLLALHLKEFDSLHSNKWTKPLRYVDAVVGFHTDKYRPAPLPDDLTPRTQELYVGLSLNLQAVFDHWLADSKHVGTRNVLHGMTEVLNAPFTSFGVTGVSRACPPPECMIGED